jgi:hypothetical protein
MVRDLKILKYANLGRYAKNLYGIGAEHTVEYKTYIVRCFTMIYNIAASQERQWHTGILKNF